MGKIDNLDKIENLNNPRRTAHSLSGFSYVQEDLRRPDDVADEFHRNMTQLSNLAEGSSLSLRDQMGVGHYPYLGRIH